MTFNQLGLSQKTLDAITAAGFDTPTPIQEQAIPAANAGQDVVGVAQTGTGKTASFVLPMLTRLESGRARARMPRSLILEPTRELATQVAEAFEQLGINHKLNVALLIGGVSFDEQFRLLDRGADVLIATPGRLMDHFGRGKLLLSGVEILVIDEADRMLDMGFIPDIEKICGMLPPKRQTLFFSATMPKEVSKLADKFLKDPKRIDITPQTSAAKTIIQKLKLAPAEAKAKRQVLRDLISELDVKNAIIFCNRKRDVAILHKSLCRHGLNAGALHGDMEQRDRTATLDAFRRGDIALLAASDVAARGLDIPAVSHIFNFDVPITPEDYVHRIGRTGRAGLEGYAATIVTPGDIDAIRAIEKLCRQKIDWLDGEPSADELEHRGRSSGRRGRARGSSEKPQRPERRSAAKPSSGASSEPGPAKPRRAAKPARTEAVKSEPAPIPAAKPEKPVAAEQRPSNGSAQRQQNERDAPRRNKPRERKPRETEVVGLGDHVPAFLMNPVRRSR
jgi:superfamily II DNA/RNA helicase